MKRSKKKPVLKKKSKKEISIAKSSLSHKARFSQLIDDAILGVRKR
jgi:hypothetical protein